MGITASLVERICQTTDEAVAEAAIGAARRLVLDGIAVAVAGSKLEPAPAILAAHVLELGGKERSSVIGFGFRTSPVSAAYVNGASMHVLDFEPMWHPANHQVSTTLPAVLALAEALECNGRQALVAMIKGIEMQGWIRQASGQFEPKVLRFHPPGQVGPMGAAVAAGHLLGLDADGLANALGIAGSRTGSLLANAGTMTKSTNCGLAVAMGLDAAMLAARGFTGNTDIFEAHKGYVEGLFDDGFEAAQLLRYGPPFRVVEPGYAIKMYPSQYGTHFAIRAALALRQQAPDPSEIETVTLITPVMPYIDRPAPETGLAGKFSWQYTAAVALLDGAVTMASFEDQRRFRPDVEDMLARIVLDMRDEIPGRFDRMHVEIRARLADGRECVARSDGPPGCWGAPPVSDEAHLAKVRECLAVRIEEQRAAAVIALVQGFETLTAGEIGELMALLAN
jgi:aconitate decarboxylase